MAGSRKTGSESAKKTTEILSDEILDKVSGGVIRKEKDPVSPVSGLDLGSGRTEDIKEEKF